MDDINNTESTATNTNSERDYFVTEKVGLCEKNGVVSPNFDAHFGPWNSTAEYLEWIRSIKEDETYVPESGVEVGIKQLNGTIKKYTWQKPYNEDGYWENNETIVGDISGAVYFNNIEALKASTELVAGDVAITKGYYIAGDGGGSVFRIISKSNSALNIYEGNHVNKGKAYDLNWKQAISNVESPYVDDATLVELQNDLYADIIVPENMEINFLQLGAKPIRAYYKAINSQGYYYSVQEDNKPYMMKWLAFNDRRMTTYNLFIPAGAYSFSPTWLLRNHQYSCSCGIRIRGECMQHTATTTILIPHTASQEYILRLGYKTKLEGGYAGTSEWLPMRSSVINNLAFGTKRYALDHEGYKLKYGNVPISSTNDEHHIIESTGNTATAGNDGYRYVTKAALWLDSCPYSQFDGLYFIHVAGSSLYLTQCYESHFGYINIRECGRISATGYVPPMVYINAPGASDVSACYFYYFNFEACYGNYFYSVTRNFSHNEFNNIQIEGSVPVSTSSTVIAQISKMASSVPYDTDSNYSVPSVGEGNVFGKWVKWFVFTGNIGLIQNYVNSISASNFGNGFKRYRTYNLSNGNVVDSNGNIKEETEYVLSNGIYYAIDSNGDKIVDFYRHYALFGQDENSSQDFQSFCWNIGTIYMFRQEGMNSYNGPWVVYLRDKANTQSLTVNHRFDRNDYPFFFRSTLKGSFSKESPNIPGAIPFVDILDSNNAAQAMMATRSGCSSPNGLCVKAGTVNAFSFLATPETTYFIRAYCTQSVYDTLLANVSSQNKPLFKWKGLLCIGDTSTPYTGEYNITINNTGWITIKMPEFNITNVTRIYFYLASGSGGNSYCNNFLRSLYLDVLISK